MATPRRRISYVIPPPTEPVPRLQLPPYGMPRDGATGPLLLAAKHSLEVDHGQHFKQTQEPRHRLGVASLALDTATHLIGRNAPEGILYTGGRDGLVISHDLGIPLRQRSRRYGYAGEGARRLGGQWEIMTGWGDEVLDEEDEEDEVALDGDILGEVSGARRRRGSRVDDPIPYEQRWEADFESQQRPKPTEFRQCVQMHSDWVNDLALCNMNQTVVSASSDGTVKAWSPHSMTTTEPSIIGSHVDYVRCLAHCRDQNWIASGSFDRTIKLWDLNRSSSTSPPQPVLTLLAPDASGPKASVYAIAADPFGHTIASGSPERVIRIWDPRSGKRVAKLVGHTDNIRSIIISEDARYLLTGSSDASIKLWSLTSQRCLHTFTHHTESVWALASSHPSLEIFYSGDRAGLACKTDVERCADVSEGECVLLAHDGGGAGQAPGGAEGISKIVALDDSRIWTATASSSVKRWRVPERRAMRAYGPAIGTDSPGTMSPRTPETSPPSPAPSPRPPGSGLPRVKGPRTSFSPSVNESLRSNGSFRQQTQESTTTLHGLPYESLIRLVSPNDPFVSFAAAMPRARDPEVATLYSAASIMSVPRQVRSPMQPVFSSSSLGVGPDAPPAAGGSARADFEEREVAAEAVPLYTEPDDVIPGETGLVRSVILNDRVHALTVDTAGEVAVWDVVRGACLGTFAREDVAAASQKGSTGSDGGERERSPREALENVRERIEGEAVVLTWCALDTKTGVLTVHLIDKCFEAEIYADEAGYNEEHFNDEQRLNLGRWVLRNLFLGFIREEQRIQRKLYDHVNDSSMTRGVQRGSAPTHIDFTNKGIQAYRERTLSNSSLKSPGIPYSTIIASPGLIPAVTPNFSSAVRASPLVTPLIQLQSIAKDKNLSPIPQSPIGTTGQEDATPMPIPGARRAATMDERPGQHALRDSDYFSLRARQAMPAAVLATPDELSGMAAKAEGAPMSPTPQTPSAGGFMGRLKNLGRNASKRAQSESGGASATPGGTSATTLSENMTTPGPSGTQLALQTILRNPLTPPSSAEAPSLALPPDTSLIISEEAPPSWRTTYRGTVASTATDVQTLEETMPMWLLEYLLANKTPTLQVVKLSFVLLPYPTKNPGEEALPELLNVAQSKLTASRFLRVRKLIGHVQEKLDKMPSTPGRTPRSSFETRGLPPMYAVSMPKPSLAVPKPRAEDVYEILCNDAVLPLDMTLAAVRQFIWRSAGELVMHYRRKPKGLSG